MDNDSDTLKISKRPPEKMEASEAEALIPAPKKQKVLSTPSNDVPCSIPANRIEDIKGTVPESFLTLQVNYLSVTVGVINTTVRSWREIFSQAKKNAPCVLHINAIECIEKHNAPIGGFRVVCLLKEELLPECIGTGVTVVGETRRLFASLPQDVTDLFTHRFTFGMMEESCRLSLLSRFLIEGQSDAASINKVPLPLIDGLSLREIAHRTPGYEAGDLLRLVQALHMELISKSEDSSDKASHCLYSSKNA
ncbi:hypothetical protein Aperf_G00000103905 [Anoplocephala perfoliata]